LTKLLFWFLELQKANSIDPSTHKLLKSFQLFPAIEILCRWSHIAQALFLQSPEEIPSSIMDSWLTLAISGDRCITEGQMLPAALGGG